jgi:hypothetical protein
MSKKWILAGLLLVFLTTAAVASAQNDVQVTHGPIIKRGVSFLQNALRAAALGPMKPPREADRGRGLITACMGRRRTPTWSVRGRPRMQAW